MVGERRSWLTGALGWVDRFVNLWTVFSGAGVAVVGGVTAYAAWATDLFSAYAPFSWVAAGIIGASLTALIFLIVQLGVRLRMKSRYDARILASGSMVNPLDRTFQNRRIYINDFVLPSFTVVKDKTFIDCEIVGPANLYWWQGNNALGSVGPRMDAVFLDPQAEFDNGITLENCMFRGCSFQRITLFVGEGDYPAVRDHGILNWISPHPKSIADRAIASLPVVIPDPPGMRAPSSD